MALQGFDPLANDRGEGLLGSAAVAGHQRGGTGHDGEFAAALHEAQLAAAVGDLCRVEMAPGNHGCFSGASNARVLYAPPGVPPQLRAQPHSYRG